MQKPITALGKKLRVKWVDFYSTTVMHACIEDQSGEQTDVCFDGRMASITCNRLFQQGRHPNKPGVALVELGSVEEGIIIPLLSNYLEQGPKASGLTEYGWDIARETLLRYGEPNMMVIPSGEIGARR